MPVVRNLERRITAAQRLGLTIEEGYAIVDNRFSKTVDIKDGDTVVRSYSQRLDKQETLDNLTAQRDRLTAFVQSLRDDIQAIRALP